MRVLPYPSSILVARGLLFLSCLGVCLVSMPRLLFCLLFLQPCMHPCFGYLSALSAPIPQPTSKCSLNLRFPLSRLPWWLSGCLSLTSSGTSCPMSVAHETLILPLALDFLKPLALQQVISLSFGMHIIFLSIECGFWLLPLFLFPLLVPLRIILCMCEYVLVCMCMCVCVCVCVCAHVCA